MQDEIGLPTFFFMLVVRVAAAIYIAITVFGILWFSDFYLEGKNFIALARMSIPSTCLFVGLLTFERWFRSGFYYWAYQVFLAIGIFFLILTMMADLDSPHGPYYAAFQVSLFPLGIIFIFVLRAFFVRMGIRKKSDAT